MFCCSMYPVPFYTDVHNICQYFMLLSSLVHTQLKISLLELIYMFAYSAFLVTSWLIKKIMRPLFKPAWSWNEPACINDYKYNQQIEFIPFLLMSSFKLISLQDGNQSISGVSGVRKCSFLDSWIGWFFEYVATVFFLVLVSDFMLRGCWCSILF